MVFKKNIFISIFNIIRYFEYIKNARCVIILGKENIITESLSDIIISKKKNYKIKEYDISNQKNVYREIKNNFYRKNNIGSNYLFKIKVRKNNINKNILYFLENIKKKKISIFLTLVDISQKNKNLLLSLFSSKTICINVDFDSVSILNKYLQIILKLNNFFINHDTYYNVYLFSLMKKKNILHTVEILRKHFKCNMKNKKLKKNFLVDKKSYLRELLSNYYLTQNKDLFKFFTVNYMNSNIKHLNDIIFFIYVYFIKNIRNQNLEKYALKRVSFCFMINYESDLDMKKLNTEKAYFRIFELIVLLSQPKLK